MQCLSGEGCNVLSRLFKSLWLNSPNDQITLFEGINRCGFSTNAKVCQKLLPRGPKRLDHRELLGGHACMEQSTQDGAGHIAPADKANVLFLVHNAWF
jgi:hypothetical protein